MIPNLKAETLRRSQLCKKSTTTVFKYVYLLNGFEYPKPQRDFLTSPQRKLPRRHCQQNWNKWPNTHIASEVVTLFILQAEGREI